MARLVARQAIELDILGLPPAVSTEYPNQEAIDQKLQLAQKQREGVSLRRQELALRQVAEMQQTRQHVIRGREGLEPGLPPRGAPHPHGEGGEDADLDSPSESEAAAAAAAAHQLSAAQQLLQMQRMVHASLGLGLG